MTGARHSRRRPSHGGFTLIELLVSLVIGLVVVLAITNLLIFGESQKRTTTSVNDMNQTGAYAVHLIDTAVRNAGSALASSLKPVDQGVLGCKLNAGNFLPARSAFSTPFGRFLGGAPSNLRVAPVLIGQNQSPAGLSDVLMVMAGYSGGGGAARRVADNNGSATSITLDSTAGYNQGDLVLVSQSGVTDCLIEPVATPTAGNRYLPLNSNSALYTSGGTTSIETLAANTASYVTPLGNINGEGSIQFQLYGVDDAASSATRNTLYSYDLLHLGANTDPQAIADGVVEIHALYGLADPASGKFTGWVQPAGSFAIDQLLNSPALMQQIVVVRLALILRSVNYEKNAGGSKDEIGVANQLPDPGALSYFDDAPTASPLPAGAVAPAVGHIAPKSLDATPTHYRWHIVDSVIPVRNMLLALQSGV